MVAPYAGFLFEILGINGVFRKRSKGKWCYEISTIRGKDNLYVCTSFYKQPNQKGRFICCDAAANAKDYIFIF
ncbi:hypothetical protein D3C85_1723660 [compost metagenome]